MNKRLWTGVFLCMYLLFGIAFSVFLLPRQEQAAPDPAAVNRILKKTEQDFSAGSFSPPDHCPYPYSVLGRDGSLLFQSSPEAFTTVTDAVRSYGIIRDVSENENVLGTLLIDTKMTESMRRLRENMLIFLSAMAAYLFIPAVLSVLYIRHTILAPFRRMADFAHHIAAGNLDFPLPMDRNHVFGAFTESFDLMREQLREARQREAEANRSKKELVASLSHDIKSPVSSIKLTSELLLAKEADGAIREKLTVIYQKSEQIDHLITNMLQSSLEDLGELKVNPIEESSEILYDIIRRADYSKKADIRPIPGCILLMDTFRMAQVIENIINNAYKYAGTPVIVESSLSEEGLRVEFKDFGPGVSEEELPHIFHKFYRGKSPSLTADGSGLGLFIVQNLMEKMGGIADAYNRENGFSVVIYIPLPRPEVLA